MILRSLLVIGGGGLILAGVLYVASTIDARDPEVLEVNLTQPVEGQAAVALITTSIEIVFSEPVEHETASGALRVEPGIDGAVSWSGSTMIFTPSDPLALDTAYRVELGSGVRDVSGNEMSESPPPFEFRTAGRPTLVEATPADGAVDVPVDAPIALTFSSLMDTSSVEAALRVRPSFSHELRWSGERLEIVPAQPLRPGAEYEVSIQDEAADVAGVALSEPIAVRFTTVAPGLAVDTLVPADGIDGVAPTSPIAIVFDRPLDPGSVSDDVLSISPDVAGTLSVATTTGETADDGGGRILQFIPSGPLPANTTFEVTLGPGVTSTGGGELGRGAEWSFTTGASLAAISNQITFVTDRAGISNVWAMNPDGTGKRQLSAELVPVLDYAVAPDGSSLVVGDGRRLVYQRADGSERRVLTDAASIEFDPAYAPSGERIVFGRADADSGLGLGLWEWQVEGGEPVAVEMPADLGGSPSPSASAGDDMTTLRAPRYSPDGQALAFVDAAGAVGIVELEAARLTVVPFVAGGAPIWLPSSSAVLITGHRAADTTAFELEAPVSPLTADRADEVARIARSGTAAGETAFGIGSRVVAVSQEGQVAYIDGLGGLHVAARAGAPSGELLLDAEPVADAAFAPGEPALVVVLANGGTEGVVERLDIGSRERIEIAPRGSLPRWVP